MKKLLLHLIFVFIAIFIITLISIFLYNFFMFGVFLIQWRTPLMFSLVISVSYIIKYMIDKNKSKDE